MGTRNLTLCFSLFLILSSGFYYLPHNAEAQGTPEYNDVSNGLPTQGLWVSKVRLHDIDEDGADEAFFLGPRKGQGDRSLHVMQWDGNAWSNVSSTFGTEVINHHSYGGFDFGDLDNDGNVDVVAGSHGKYNVSAFYRGSGGNWDENVVEKECEGCNSQDAWSIDVGDYNADGRLDVLIGGQMDMVLTPFANSGDGNWTQQNDGIIMGRASTLQGYFVDINRDGFLDLIANLRDGVWVYLGDGNGGWTDSSAGLPVESGTNDSPFSLDWGDFNNDGFVDLALCTVDNGDSHLYAFSGDGEGGWTDNSVGLPNQAYVTVKLADMNQDKYDDIVGVTPNGVVETYLATETGGWVKSQNTLQGNARGHRLEVGDFDHNGHRDIIAGFGTDQTGYPGSVKVWRESTAVSSLGVDMDYPDGMETFRGGSIRFIHWLSEIPSTTGSRSVKLEYSIEGSEGGWTTIAEGLPDTGTFQWEVPFKNSADSFLKVTLTDELGTSVDDISDNSFAIISPSNYPPDMEVGEPGGAIADGSYSITWVASDPDGDQVAIDLYYDTDTQPNEKQLIAANLENSGEYEWDTSGIAEGDYYLVGVATDSTSQEKTDYTSETLQIEHNDSPEIAINTPSSQGAIADDSYVIRWQATDPDSDELVIELLYSMTENLDDAVTIETGLANNGEYEWDTSQIEDGEWFVCGTVSDGNLGGEDCSDYSLEINHTQPNNAPEIVVYSPAPFGFIDDGVEVQWSVTDPDGDPLEIDLFFRHSSNTELATISSGLPPSGSLFWDTRELDEDDYYLAISASDGQATSWRNVSVSIVHPEFLVVLAPIQVISTDPSEGDNMAFFVVVSNAGGLDGIAELTWSVDGEAASTTLIDLVAGTDDFSQFDWIATSGDHTITVSTGEASQSVLVSVSSAPEIEAEDGLNPWMYSIPVIAAVGGIAILLRRMRGSGGDDEDEFEWE
ncbi:MAG: FG-GAP-like repeat-containing protein [Candidatus Poseidoniia archaeon]|nr:FG-GAP-like repeat-containing protein [Candidatus Poseidoniia archaeon]